MIYELISFTEVTCSVDDGLWKALPTACSCSDKELKCDDLDIDFFQGTVICSPESALETCTSAVKKLAEGYRNATNEAICKTTDPVIKK